MEIHSAVKDRHMKMFETFHEIIAACQRVLHFNSCIDVTVANTGHDEGLDEHCEYARNNS